MLSVVVKMLEILLYSINWLVSLIDSLIMLRWIYVWWESVREVSRNVTRCVLSEKALQKFLYEVPAENWHETWSVVNLNQNSFKGLILTHWHATELDKKVSQLKSRTLWFNLYQFFGCVNWIHFQHQQIKDEIGN